MLCVCVSVYVCFKCFENICPLKAKSRGQILPINEEIS